MQQRYQCPTCCAPVAFEQRFCENCRAQLNRPAQQFKQQPAYGNGQEETEQCPACGVPVAFEQRFCENCRAQLNRPAQQLKQQQTYGNGQKKTEHKKINYGLIVYIALIVVVLLAAVWVFKPISLKAPSCSIPVTHPASTSQE